MQTIDVSDLSIAFYHHGQRKEVVSDVSFQLNAGQMTALVGESGSGKSLTALALMQLLPSGAMVSEKASICYDGDELLQKTAREMSHIRGGKIGMVFQEALVAFNPILTIGEQILEVVIRHKYFRGKEAFKYGCQLLREVGLDDEERCWRAYPHQLSGGMRQRAMVAMALAGDPEFLIADEPTSAIDVVLQQQMMQLFKRLMRERGIGVLMITHDLPLVRAYADEVLVMMSGRLIEKARADVFFQGPTSAYAKTLLQASYPQIKKQPTSLQKHARLMFTKHMKVHFPIQKGLFKRTVGCVKAIDGLDFDLLSGETLAIVGGSGSGKSTLARSIMMMQKISSGELCFANRHLVSLSRKERRQYCRQVQMIFQDPYQSLDPRQTIFSILSEPLKIHKIKLSEQKMHDYLHALLKRVGLLPEHLMRFPHEFSGGQRQRIAIARALVLKPKLLICDEPTSALDVTLRHQILDLLASIQREMGMTLIMITHDFAVVQSIADRVLVMCDGRMMEVGTMTQVTQAPQSSYTKSLIQAVG